MKMEVDKSVVYIPETSQELNAGLFGTHSVRMTSVNTNDYLISATEVAEIKQSLATIHGIHSQRAKNAGSTSQPQANGDLISRWRRLSATPKRNIFRRVVERHRKSTIKEDKTNCVNSIIDSLESKTSTLKLLEEKVKNQEDDLEEKIKLIKLQEKLLQDNDKKNQKEIDDINEKNEKKNQKEIDDINEKNEKKNQKEIDDINKRHRLESQEYQWFKDSHRGCDSSKYELARLQEEHRTCTKIRDDLNALRSQHVECEWRLKDVDMLRKTMTELERQLINERCTNSEAIKALRSEYQEKICEMNEKLTTTIEHDKETCRIAEEIEKQLKIAESAKIQILKDSDMNMKKFEEEILHLQEDKEVLKQTLEDFAEEYEIMRKMVKRIEKERSVDLSIHTLRENKLEEMKSEWGNEMLSKMRKMKENVTLQQSKRDEINAVLEAQNDSMLSEMQDKLAKCKEKNIEQKELLTTLDVKLKQSDVLNKGLEKANKQLSQAKEKSEEEQVKLRMEIAKLNAELDIKKSSNEKQSKQEQNHGDTRCFSDHLNFLKQSHLSSLITPHSQPIIMSAQYDSQYSKFNTALQQTQSLLKGYESDYEDRRKILEDLNKPIELIVGTRRNIAQKKIVHGPFGDTTIQTIHVETQADNFKHLKKNLETQNKNNGKLSKEIEFLRLDNLRLLKDNEKLVEDQKRVIYDLLQAKQDSTQAKHSTSQGNDVIFSQLQNTIKILQEDNRSAQQRIENLQKEHCSELKDSKNHLHEDLNILRDTHNKCAQIEKELKDEIKALNKDLEAEKVKTNCSHDQMLMQRQHHEKIENMLRDQIMKTQKQVDDYAVKMNYLEEKREAIMDEHSKQQAFTTSLVNSRRESQDDQREVANESVSQIKILLEKISKLEHDNADSRKEIEKMEQKLDDNSEEVAMLTNKNRNLKELTNDKQEEIDKLQNKITKLQKEISNLTDENDNHQSEMRKLNNTKKTIDDLKTQLADAEGEIDGLKSGLKEKDLALTKSAEEKDEILRKSAEEKQKLLAKIKEEKEEILTKTNEEKQEILKDKQDLVNDFESVKRENEKLSKDSENISEKCNELRKEIQELSDYKTEIELKMQTLQDEIDNYEAKSKDSEPLSNQLDTWKTKNDALRTKIKGLETELNDVQSKFDTLRMEKKQKDFEFEELRKKFISVQSNRGERRFSCPPATSTKEPEKSGRPSWLNNKSDTPKTDLNKKDSDTGILNTPKTTATRGRRSSLTAPAQGQSLEDKYYGAEYAKQVNQEANDAILNRSRGPRRIEVKSGPATPVTPVNDSLADAEDDLINKCLGR